MLLLCERRVVMDADTCAYTADVDGRFTHSESPAHVDALRSRLSDSMEGVPVMGVGGCACTSSVGGGHEPERGLDGGDATRGYTALHGCRVP